MVEEIDRKGVIPDTEDNTGEGKGFFELKTFQGKQGMVVEVFQEAPIVISDVHEEQGGDPEAGIENEKIDDE